MLFGLTSDSPASSSSASFSKAQSSNGKTRRNDSDRGGVGIGSMGGWHSRLASTDEQPQLEDQESQLEHDEMLEQILQEVSACRELRLRRKE